MNLEGIAVIVTGGASGLGQATAARLARAGARVTILDVNGDAGASVAASLGGLFIRTDICDESNVVAALDQAEARHGKARVLVNCAGMGPPAKIIGRDGQPFALADFAKVISINLLGTVSVMAKFAARIHDAPPIGEERGVIVNTASVAAFDGQIGQAAYAASKGALVSLTLPVARELARYGIRVMTIAPGLFRTPLLATLPQAAQDSLAQQVPFPSRLGAPDEFALLVESIVVNPMLNGETIRLDGAIRMAAR